MVYCCDHTMFTICTKSFTLTTEHIEGDIKTNLRPQEFYCPENCAPGFEIPGSTNVDHILKSSPDHQANISQT